VTQKLVLSIDAMGGDAAPAMAVDGCELASERFPFVEFLLYGDEPRLAPLVAQTRYLKSRARIVHTPEIVTGDMKPSVALRAGRKSSMRLAIDAVKDGEAAGVVSAGNTGAMMAMAKIALRMVPGIDRPAIASLFPTTRGESVMLDLGANVECDANNLVQFALMGEVFARTVLGLTQPSVGLLNVGSEEMKGHEELRLAAAQLRETHLPIRFHGFIEGDDVPAGTVDVVVTDGFTGNIALKIAEGTAKLFGGFLRGAFSSSILSKIGYLFARSALAKVRLRTDPRRYNGAMFVGVNGIVVKSHGGTDALGFANAIGVAVDMATHGFNDKIKAELARLGVTAPVPAAEAASG
jgi:glycerol-3-phosphate acyltransferase PlsX